MESQTETNDQENIQSKYYTKVCKFYLRGDCKKDNCTFIHGEFKYVNNKKKSNHQNYNRHANLKNKKNTTSFEPMDGPTDLRILYDLNFDKLNTELTDRDLLLVPNAFSKYNKYELYYKLVDEITELQSKNPDILKLWHGNNKIAGTHFIADDKLNWKDKCPTFNNILNELVQYFNVDIKATRFNWYQNTEQWKPFHHDAAAFDERKSLTQNITIALSFGCTRTTALEYHEFNKNNKKTTISIPIADGEIYAFTNTTNKLWKHGILQENKYKEEGRISIIIWGWVDNIKKE